MTSITFGILTISDTSYENKENDKSGPMLQCLLTQKDFENEQLFKSQIMCSAIVPDNEFKIMETLVSWSDNLQVNVILTTGGTGFASTDVTPEATKKIINKEAPGISYAMFMESFKITPMAVLSRSVCGIRGQTLIINLPGSPKAVKECFSVIKSAIPHAVDLILNTKENVKETHYNIQNNTLYHKCSHQKSNISMNLDNVAERPRESPFPLISLEEAQKLLENSIDKEIISVNVNIWNSFGRVLAKTIHSPCNIPPFRASMKDGYAVLAKDGIGKYKVLGAVEAGQEPGKVKITSGTCTRINTGAPVPDDATAVVQVEDTRLLLKSADGKEEKEIEILTAPRDGQDIRAIGSDVAKNNVILQAGTKIGSVEIGILAASGCSEIPVTSLPKIGVLSTGNELQNPGEIPKVGYIYDSNKITLIMMLKENGYNAVDLGIAIDQETVMINTIEKALKEVDLIITTGSVSMGDRDMLKPILKNIFNATILFGRVNLKPGKPTTYATCEYNGKKKYFLCLPGNPVSAFVTANLFVLPFLNKFTKNNAKNIVLKAKLTSKYFLDERPEFARVILIWFKDEAYPKAYSTGIQISSKLLNCKNANAFLMLPGRSAEQSVLEVGTLVSAMLIGFDQHDDYYHSITKYEPVRA